MTRTIASLIALTLAATPLAAQDQSQQPQDSEPAARNDAPPPEQALTASMLENASIVALEGDYTNNIWQDSAPLATMIADLREIGQTQEIVMDASGQVFGLTTDVGGFLGIGTKSVLIPLSDIRLARTDGADGEITVVTRLSQQQLEDAPSYELDN